MTCAHFNGNSEFLCVVKLSDSEIYGRIRGSGEEMSIISIQVDAEVKIVELGYRF